MVPSFLTFFKQTPILSTPLFLWEKSETPLFTSKIIKIYTLHLKREEGGFHLCSNSLLFNKEPIKNVHSYFLFIPTYPTAESIILNSFKSTNIDLHFRSCLTVINHFMPLVSFVPTENRKPPWFIYYI